MQESNSDPRYHTATWQKLRKMCLRMRPICEHCKKTASTVAHHDEPVEDGGEFFDLDNLMGLCRGCHEIEHRRKKQ